MELQPLQKEGGWYRRTWGSVRKCSDKETPCGSAIYFLITTDNFSALHRLPKDEIFHFYAGDPVRMLWLNPEGQGQWHTLGPDIGAGQSPQLCVPANTWQASKVERGKGLGWSLLGTTMAPAFEWEDYEHGERENLIADYPEWKEAIIQHTRE